MLVNKWIETLPPKMTREQLINSYIDNQVGFYHSKFNLSCATMTTPKLIKLVEKHGIKIEGHSMLEIHVSFKEQFEEKKTRPTRISPDEKEKIRELYDSGMTQKQISEIYNVAECIISTYMKRHKIQTRGRGNKYKVA